MKRVMNQWTFLFGVLFGVLLLAFSCGTAWGEKWVTKRFTGEASTEAEALSRATENMVFGVYGGTVRANQVVRDGKIVRDDVDLLAAGLVAPKSFRKIRSTKHSHSKGSYYTVEVEGTFDVEATPMPLEQQLRESATVVEGIGPTIRAKFNQADRYQRLIDETIGDAFKKLVTLNVGVDRTRRLENGVEVTYVVRASVDPSRYQDLYDQVQSLCQGACEDPKRHAGEIRARQDRSTTNATSRFQSYGHTLRGAYTQVLTAEHIGNWTHSAAEKTPVATVLVLLKPNYRLRESRTYWAWYRLPFVVEPVGQPIARVTLTSDTGEAIVDDAVPLSNFLVAQQPRNGRPNNIGTAIIGPAAFSYEYDRAKYAPSDVEFIDDYSVERTVKLTDSQLGKWNGVSARVELLDREVVDNDLEPRTTFTAGRGHHE